MGAKCSTVVFSTKAYNAIIRETFEHEPVETGGILLGHVVDDTWVVMEVLPPGIHSIFQVAYFEYDEEFVNYLAHSVANQYKRPLSLLGLWHRHPGSMDTFSGTDDLTNRTFARQLPQGVISGLVNVDPRFRFTMYYLNAAEDDGVGRPNYRRVEIEVGDDIIPADFFALRYFDNAGNADLHPTADMSKETRYRRSGRTHVNPEQNSQQTLTDGKPSGSDKGVEEGLQSASDRKVFLECGKRCLRLLLRYWKEITISVLIVCVTLLLTGKFGKSKPAAPSTPKPPITLPLTEDKTDEELYMELMAKLSVEGTEIPLVLRDEEGKLDSLKVQALSGGDLKSIAVKFGIELSKPKLESGDIENKDTIGSDETNPDQTPQ